MMTLDIRKLFPRFILNDQEGYAMARALESGMNDFLAICEAAEKNWGDVDSMPEWRLDELAWEYNLPYDSTASIQQKRSWIANAWELSRDIGTPAGIKNFLAETFTSVVLEEGTAAELQPFHFIANITGVWTEQKFAWAEKSIALAKNARSVVDEIRWVGTESTATAATTDMEDFAIEIFVHSVTID